MSFLPKISTPTPTRCTTTIQTLLLVLLACQRKSLPLHGPWNSNGRSHSPVFSPKFSSVLLSVCRSPPSYNPPRLYLWLSLCPVIYSLFHFSSPSPKKPLSSFCRIKIPVPFLGRLSFVTPRPRPLPGLPYPRLRTPTTHKTSTKESQRLINKQKRTKERLSCTEGVYRDKETQKVVLRRTCLTRRRNFSQKVPETDGEGLTKDPRDGSIGGPEKW